MIKQDIFLSSRDMIKRIVYITCSTGCIAISGFAFSDPAPVTVPVPISVAEPNTADAPAINAVPDDVIKSSLPQQPVTVSPATPISVSQGTNTGEGNTTNTASSEGNIPAGAITPDNGKISFYFQNVSVKTLLQLIAKNSGLNFIISDNVKGNTTLNLKNVSWRQALDIVLQSNGLSTRPIGTALFISTTEDIAQKQAREFQAAQDVANMSPLSTAFINLKYSDASVMAKVLKSSEGSLLTPRGEVSINSPTNTIIVRDVKTNLAEVRKFINRLDIPARQVSIEARIVNIDTSYEAQLGVRFGVSNTRSLSGTFAGASQLVLMVPTFLRSCLLINGLISIYQPACFLRALLQAA